MPHARAGTPGGDERKRERERESCSLSLRARRLDTGRDGDALGGSSTGISPWLEPNLHPMTGAGAADLTNVARGAARSATTLPPLTRGARRLVDGYLLRSLSRRILLSSRALRSFLLTSVSAVAFALSRARARSYPSAHRAVLPVSPSPLGGLISLSLSRSIVCSFTLCLLFLLLLLVLPHRLLVSPGRERFCVQPHCYARVVQRDDAPRRRRNVTTRCVRVYPSGTERRENANVVLSVRSPSPAAAAAARVSATQRSVSRWQFAVRRSALPGQINRTPFFARP